MGECEQSTTFYFRAINSFDRISAGDMVLIDMKCEIEPGAIVLSEASTFEKAGDVISETHIGKVTAVYIQQ